MSAASNKDKDIPIYKDIDFFNAASLKRHFPIKKDYGKMNPPRSIIGKSKNYIECFASVRQWRRTMPKKQNEIIEKYRKMTRTTKNKFTSNMNYMMKNKELLIQTCNLTCRRVEVEDDEEDDCDREKENVDNNEGRRFSNRAMEKVAQEKAIARHPTILQKHIGLGSKEDDRKRAVGETSGNAKKSRRRNSHQRPNDCAQAGDSSAQSNKYRALLHMAKFSDIATLKRPKNTKLSAPRVMSVTIILDQVQPSSVNGGRLSDCRRAKPELIVLADCKEDVKEVMNAASNVLSRSTGNELQYERRILHRDTTTEMLQTTVKKYIADEKKKRQGLAVKPLGIKEILAKSVTEDVV